MNSHIDEIVRPTDIKANLLLSVISYATMLESQFSDWLLPADPGVYMPGDIQPVLVPGRSYYIRVGQELVAISDIDKVESNVYDSNHRIVINQYTMMHKKHFLTPHPTVPVRGIRLMHKLIEFEITSLLRWCPHASGCENRILMEFKPEWRNHIDTRIIREAGRYVTQQVHEFIGNDDWNYYHTRIQGLEIIVEKGPDYRVCEWYEMKLKPEQRDAY